MNIIRLSFFIGCTFVFNMLQAQMGFVNNGMMINIENGAYINVNDFTNNPAGGIDGTFDLDGNIIVNGNFTNNSSGNVFTNIEAIPDGNILLAGNDQSIQGITPIYFENLDIRNATKTLDLTNCEVKGIFTIDGVMDLNKNRLILDNGNTGAIAYDSGYLKSETFPVDGLGEIEWKLGSNIGSYSVPFGSGAGTNDLNLTLKTETAASPTDGSVVFATYPTDAYNKPYPSGIANLDTFKAEDVADRYWKVEPKFTAKPDISLYLRYTANDVDQTDNPQMKEQNLKAIRYNDVSNTWIDMKMTGNCDVPNKTVMADHIQGNDFYTYWALSEFTLKIPNAFTPDGDGKNDVFLKGYEVKIVNRWGEKLFEGPDGWDGKINGEKVSPGTYFYIATIPDLGTNKTVTGVITVVSK